MNESKNVSRLFMCIGIVFVTCLLLSNLVAGKMWAVTPDITLPAAVILFPVTYIIGDVFTEVYGFRKARTIIWLGFACSFFAVLVYLVTIALPHPGYWENQEAYAIVMGTTPRVAIASFSGYLFGEFSNSIILSKLKVATKGKKLWVRTIFSTVIGEGLDSVIFIVIWQFFCRQTIKKSLSYANTKTCCKTTKQCQQYLFSHNILSFLFISTVTKKYTIKRNYQPRVKYLFCNRFIATS